MMRAEAPSGILVLFVLVNRAGTPIIQVLLQGLPDRDGAGDGPVTAAPTPSAEEKVESNATPPPNLESKARPADNTEPGDDRYTPGAGAVLQTTPLPGSI